jgi:hypothetical protein
MAASKDARDGSKPETMKEISKEATITVEND